MTHARLYTCFFFLYQCYAYGAYDGNLLSAEHLKTIKYENSILETLKANSKEDKRSLKSSC